MRYPSPHKWLAILALTVVASGCFVSETVSIDTSSPLGLAIQPALIPSAADGSALPINRIRTSTIREGDGALLGETVQDVSPSAEEWEVVIPPLGVGEVTVVVLLYLINVDGNGDEAVQFSGRSDPIAVVPGVEASPEVPFVRGPLSNLGVTSVTIESAPTPIVEGQRVPVGAVATFTGAEAPTIFWSSLDGQLLEVIGDTVVALAVGTGRVTASAGAYADTVEIVVLSSDQLPPTVVSTNPASGALGVGTSSAISVTFDEDVLPASADTTTVLLTDSVGAPVAGVVTTSGPTVTFQPTTALDTMATYTATVTTGVTDLVGNALAADVAWSFTTAGSAVLIETFSPGLGTLVAVAFDPVSRTLLLHDDFSSPIREYSLQGTVLDTLTLIRPGPSSNDIDLTLMPVAGTIGSTQVAANTLLVHNGEVAPGTLYAVDRQGGTVLDSIAPQTTGNPIGGAFHGSRGTFFSAAWNTDVISELDPTTGAVLNAFPVTPIGSPAWGIFYGDMEISPASGNLLIVSSEQNSIRILTPDGSWVRDVDLTGLGISGMSGIAWDAQTATAWIVSTNGLVYHVGSIE